MCACVPSRLPFHLHHAAQHLDLRDDLMELFDAQYLCHLIEDAGAVFEILHGKNNILPANFLEIENLLLKTRRETAFGVLVGSPKVNEPLPAVLHLGNSVLPPIKDVGMEFVLHVNEKGACH